MKWASNRSIIVVVSRSAYLHTTPPSPSQVHKRAGSFELLINSLAILDQLYIFDMGGQTSEANLSLLWEKAEKRYHQDLASDKEFAKILETRSLEELLADTHVLQPADPFERELPCTIGQLEPAFKSLSDFLVILKMSYGADSAQTALVWGSIRVILTVGVLSYESRLTLF